MKTRVLVTVGAAGLICAQLLAAQTVDQPGARPDDPWAKLPALPTACYSSQDQSSERHEAALTALRNELRAQSDINDAIRQKSIDNTDMMAVAARLQQKMMEDPANAQKYMEQMNAQNQQAQAETPAQLEKEQRIEAESDAVMNRYKAALTRARASGNARLEALLKKYKPPIHEDTEAMWLRIGDPSDPESITPEKHAILKEWDRAYVETCAQWWSATGPIHGYMKRYNDFLLSERIPYEREFLDKPKLDHYETLGTPTTGWRTTTDYEAVEDYMSMASKLFDQREAEPWCRNLPSERCQ
jgi:hypothetical protein